MKKLCLRFVSIAIVCMTFFSSVIPSSAILEEYSGRTCPRIFVHGFMAYDIHSDKSNPDSELVYPIPAEKTSSVFENIKSPVGDFLLKRDYEKLGSEVSALISELFEDLYCGFDGEPVNQSGVVTEYPKPEEVKKDSAVIFGYDWRTDPVESAKQLDEFIDYMLKYSGAKQVVIDSHSLGSVITFTYLRLYGTEKVKSVVFNAAGIYGQTYTGELLSGNLVVNKDAILNYMSFAFDGMENKSVMLDLIDALDKLGVAGGACKVADKLVDEILDDVAFDIVRLFGNWPTIWAMVPDDMLEQAEEYVFGKVFKENNVDYTGLKEKIDTYNELVRKDKTEALKEMSKTVNIYVISRHGYSSLPVSDSWQTVGDGVIDTRYSSFGATVAPYGETLDTAKSEYISPDANIDALTSLFPDQTWFIRGLRHSDMPDSVDRMIDDLLYYDGKATVTTFSQYPRFMEYNISDGSLSPDKGNQEKDGFNFILLALILALLLINGGIVLIIILIVKKIKKKKQAKLNTENNVATDENSQSDNENQADDAVLNNE